MYVCSVGPSYEQAHLIRRINIVLTLRFVAHFSGAANPDGGQEWRVGHLSPAKSDSGPSFGTQVSAVCENVEVDPLEAFCRNWSRPTATTGDTLTARLPFQRWNLSTRREAPANQWAEEDRFSDFPPKSGHTRGGRKISARDRKLEGVSHQTGHVRRLEPSLDFRRTRARRWKVARLMFSYPLRPPSGTIPEKTTSCHNLPAN